MKTREIVIVLGKTGQGKSVWTRSFLQNKKRIFAFDPLQDFDANYLYSSVALADRIDSLRDVEADATTELEYKIAVSRIELLELLGVGSFLVGNNYLMIEECAYCFEKGMRIPQWLRDIIFLGRHRGVSLIVTAQRPVSIPIDLRSQASRVVSFSQHEGADMDWLRDYFGEKIWDIPSLDILECLDSEYGQISRYRLGIPAKTVPKTSNSDENNL